MFKFLNTAIYEMMIVFCSFMSALYIFKLAINRILDFELYQTV
jgi:hypothetical protein